VSAEILLKNKEMNDIVDQDTLQQAAQIISAVEN
jgi:hypothetical protein